MGARANQVRGVLRRVTRGNPGPEPARDVRHAYVSLTHCTSCASAARAYRDLPGRDRSASWAGKVRQYVRAGMSLDDAERHAWRLYPEARPAMEAHRIRRDSGRYSHAAYLEQTYPAYHGAHCDCAHCSAVTRYGGTY